MKRKRRVCRSRKSGRFARKDKCGAFKRTLVRVVTYKAWKRARC